MTVSWQQLVAALGNDRLRRVYAAWVLADADSPDAPDATEAGAAVAFERSAERTAIDLGTAAERAKLTHAGLLMEVDGRHRVARDVFNDVLAAAGNSRPTGVDRFFAQGMLTGIPRNAADRDELLGHLVIRLFGSEDVLSEPEVNRLLSTVTGDVPTLRRALVDFGFLRRDRDGSLYWRTA
ncbi:DUF2087 domain-containing protein [Arthrobacter sp. H14-L1]|uniref:DUF2087 domain-containing protein n=1 Tax=Arthrobacter sp. H14-L1 TaxID=2996697 RepID=UPI00226EB032|nr:DUF2087 domain-containing protein [Arthrobacter sp. H14-L1]MCY0904587.1 DUF2087 domain-containing protein [Arthrobacter sp. H14-L1]